MLDAAGLPEDQSPGRPVLLGEIEGVPQAARRNLSRSCLIRYKRSCLVERHPGALSHSPDRSQLPTSGADPGASAPRVRRSGQPRDGEEVLVRVDELLEVLHPLMPVIGERTCPCVQIVSDGLGGQGNSRATAGLVVGRADRRCRLRRSAFRPCSCGALPNPVGSASPPRMRQSGLQEGLRPAGYFQTAGCPVWPPFHRMAGARLD